MKNEMLVGAVFVAALILTAFATIVVSGLHIFTHTDTWLVESADVGGLKTGDDVRVLGAKMGVVRQIKFDKSKNVFTIRAEMERGTPIHEHYEIATREASALGGRYLDVNPGPFDGALVDTYHLESHPGLTGSLNSLLVKLDKTVDAVNEAQGTLGKLIMKDDIYQNIKDASESLKTIVSRIESGQGVIGRLINEDEIYVTIRDMLNRLNNGKGALAKLMQDDSGKLIDDLSDTAANLRSITAKADAGTGTIGKLINDPALYDNATSTFADANKLVTEARDGKGILGMLMHDEKARQQLSNLIQNLDSIVERTSNGEGTLGRLLTDDRVYNNLLSATEHFDSVLAKVDNGQGTIGKFVNDSELYDKIKRLVSRAIDSIENTRDSAPVSAVTTFVLSPFQ